MSKAAVFRSASLFVVVLAVALVGQIFPCPLPRVLLPWDLLTVEDGKFTEDISQISFDKIPTLDRESAEYLGDRQMGTLSDMVSQFEYSNDSTQINYQGRPVGWLLSPTLISSSGSPTGARACPPMYW